MSLGVSMRPYLPVGVFRKFWACFIYGSFSWLFYFLLLCLVFYGSYCLVDFMGVIVSRRPCMHMWGYSAQFWVVGFIGGSTEFLVGVVCWRYGS